MTATQKWLGRDEPILVNLNADPLAAGLAGGMGMPWPHPLLQEIATHGALFGRARCWSGTGVPGSHFAGQNRSIIGLATH